MKEDTDTLMNTAVDIDGLSDRKLKVIGNAKNIEITKLS